MLPNGVVRLPQYRNEIEMWRKQGFNDWEIYKKINEKIVIDRVSMELKFFGESWTWDKMCKKRVTKDWIARQIMAMDSRKQRSEAEWVLNRWKLLQEATGKGTRDLWARYWMKNRYDIVAGQIRESRNKVVKGVEV